MLRWVSLVVLVLVFVMLRVPFLEIVGSWFLFGLAIVRRENVTKKEAQRMCKEKQKNEKDALLDSYNKRLLLKKRLL